VCHWPSCDFSNFVTLTSKFFALKWYVFYLMGPLPDEFKVKNIEHLK